MKKVLFPALLLFASASLIAYDEPHDQEMQEQPAAQQVEHENLLPLPDQTAFPAPDDEDNHELMEVDEADETLNQALALRAQLTVLENQLNGQLAAQERQNIIQQITAIQEEAHGLHDNLQGNPRSSMVMLNILNRIVERAGNTIAAAQAVLNAAIAAAALQAAAHIFFAGAGAGSVSGSSSR